MDFSVQTQMQNLHHDYKKKSYIVIMVLDDGLYLS